MAILLARKLLPIVTIKVLRYMQCMEICDFYNCYNPHILYAITITTASTYILIYYFLPPAFTKQNDIKTCI